MTLTELRYIVMLACKRHFGRVAEKYHISSLETIRHMVASGAGIAAGRCDCRLIKDIAI